VTAAPPPESPEASAPAALRPLPATTFLVGGAALFVWLFLPILSLRWRFYEEQPRYSHCPLLPLVALAWVYDRWDALRAVPRAASRTGLVAAALAVAAYLYGRVVSNNLLQHVAMLGTVASVVWALAGARLLRALAFPLGYLLLTIPLPKTWDEELTQPLQRVASVIAESTFDALGWVVVRQGNVLQLPGLKLLVEDACSGVHSLYALVALGIAWVAFVPRPAWLRVVLVAATFPVALVANALRVIFTGVLAYKVDPKYAEGTSHAAAGMIVFATGLGLFVLVDWCLKPDEPEA
jgi:exosortase